MDTHKVILSTILSQLKRWGNSSLEESFPVVNVWVLLQTVHTVCTEQQPQHKRIHVTPPSQLNTRIPRDTCGGGGVADIFFPVNKPKAQTKIKFLWKSHSQNIWSKHENSNYVTLSNWPIWTKNNIIFISIVNLYTRPHTYWVAQRGFIFN